MAWQKEIATLVNHARKELVCVSATRWMKKQASYEEAWDNCQRGAWLAYLLLCVNGDKIREELSNIAYDAGHRYDGRIMLFDHRHNNKSIQAAYANAIREQYERPDLTHKESNHDNLRT